MKYSIYVLALFAALIASDTIAQTRNIVVNRTYDPGVYRDDRGEYRWQVIERRVWVPEYQTRGILGIGSRTVPGHYEMRTDRVKIYSRDDSYDDKGKKGKNGKHPHGMPPGQRKKLEREGRYY